MTTSLRLDCFKTNGRKNNATIPDPRYPGKNPIRFFLRREDAEALLIELLDQNPRLRDKEVYAVKVKLVSAIKGVAADKPPGNANCFVVHSPNEVYEWLREKDIGNDMGSR